MKILIDTSPLTNANAIRGIGVYTRWLTEHLQDIDELELKLTTADNKQNEFKPDLIHYPFFDLFFATLPMVRAKPTVVTVHDVIPLKYPEHYPAGVKGKVKLQKQKLALKTCQAVITDSHASKKDIEDLLGIASDKIHVVYLAANPELEHKKDKAVAEVKKKYELPDNYLLYVGDINYNKNIPQLIKALKFVPDDLELVLVGKNFKQQDIPEWKWIETQIALSDVADRVHLLNEITGDADDELSAIYSGASVYVQPSLYEGFGLPVLEAMQCKTPVVAAKNSSLIEVGGEYAFFTGEEAEELGEAVNQVLDLTQAERSKRTTAAYEWSQTFSWEKTAKETVRVYQSVLEK